MTGSAHVASTVRLEPWAEDDLDLLRRINAPEMTEHLGGPETDQQVAERNCRYASADGRTSRMYKIVALPGEQPAGSVGYWEKEWRGQTVYETGWSVLPEHQGRGLAAAATQVVIEVLRAGGRHRWLHAYPKVDNAASNAICRKTGFELLGECEFEYPPGNPIRCHDWRFDLRDRP